MQCLISGKFAQNCSVSFYRTGLKCFNWNPFNKTIKKLDPSRTLPYLVPVFSSGTIILDEKTFPIDSLGHLRVCKSLLIVASTSAGGPERSGVRVSGQESLQRGQSCAPYSRTSSFLRGPRHWYWRVLQGAACVHVAWGPPRVCAAGAQHEQDQTCFVVWVGSQRI